MGCGSDDDGGQSYHATRQNRRRDDDDEGTDGIWKGAGYGATQQPKSASVDANPPSSISQLLEMTRIPLRQATAAVGETTINALAGEMEPVGQCCGSLIGSLAGRMIRSPRGADIGGNIGATVGRGVSELMRSSELFHGGGGQQPVE
jgi:hypothetical protein